MEPADFLTGVPGPVLVLADNRAIAVAAPSWAAAFAAAGKIHRVRLVGRASEREVAAVVAEAEQLGAAAILAAGSGPPVEIGQAAASRLGRPLLTAP